MGTRDALVWSESVLGVPIIQAVELTGGMTSTMLALTDATGQHAVLRLMTNEPWRSHGAALTSRERAAQLELASTPVPAPRTLGLDAEGRAVGVAAHLMSHVRGTVLTDIDRDRLTAMAAMLACIHDVVPTEPFRTYQSWAWEAKWIVPAWAEHPASWQAAFALLSQEPPPYEPRLLHRDFSHRNLLWVDGVISGVVDWVETSTGPAWLDAAHAATNLAVAFGLESARAFLSAYDDVATSRPDRYWLVMDAVGFLPPPGKRPMFRSPGELARLDNWLHELMSTAEWL